MLHRVLPPHPRPSLTAKLDQDYRLSRTQGLNLVLGIALCTERGAGQLV